MSWLKCLSVVIFSSQLLTYTSADSNATEDAQLALNTLHNEIETANNLISITADLWTTYSTNNSEMVNRQLKNDVQDFRLLVNNITKFAQLADNGKECLSSLDVFFDTENDTGVISNEEDIFRYLLSLAIIEVNNTAKHFDDLNEEFSTNCLQNRTHCEGITLAIVDQVARLITKVRRIPYELMAEVHLLDYKLGMNLVNQHTILMNNYSKAMENATLCIASKLELYRKANSTSVAFNQETPEDVKDSILSSYYNLLNIVLGTFLTSIENLLSPLTDILNQCESDYVMTIYSIRNTSFKANQTINSLLNIAKNLNTTVNCTTPDLLSVINTSISRGLDEYKLLVNTMTTRYNDGISKLNNTYMEVTSIGLQMKECVGNSTCDYLSEKIAMKTVDIPLWLQSSGNSTAVLLYQTVMSVRESGSKILRDQLGQFETGIVNLKYCVVSSFY